jgi:hypothetical protein
MNDSVLGKYTSRRPEPETAASADSEGADDLGSFGWPRGVRDRALMLELPHKDGKVTAFGYAWLERAELDPSEGIMLHFAGKVVRIVGRTLDAESRANARLFLGVVRHRVPWIRETDRATALHVAGRETVVESIQIA